MLREYYFHFLCFFQHPGFLLLMRIFGFSALYLKGDPYESSDAVFGVKKSLVVELGKVDEATAKEYGVKEGSWLLKHDFVLSTQQETEELRDRLAVEELEKLGLRMKLVDHLPVPELD